MVFSLQSEYPSRHQNYCLRVLSTYARKASLLAISIHVMTDFLLYKKHPDLLIKKIPNKTCIHLQALHRNPNNLLLDHCKNLVLLVFHQTYLYCIMHFNYFQMPCFRNYSKHQLMDISINNLLLLC